MRTAYETVATSTLGQLPGHSDRTPRLDLPKVRIRALSASFFAHGKIVDEGELLIVDKADAAGLIARKLAELVDH